MATTRKSVFIKLLSGPWRFGCLTSLNAYTKTRRGRRLRAVAAPNGMHTLCMDHSIALDIDRRITNPDIDSNTGRMALAFRICLKVRRQLSGSLLTRVLAAGFHSAGHDVAIKMQRLWYEKAMSPPRTPSLRSRGVYSVVLLSKTRFA